MVHQDHETRVGAQRIFSVVLVPSSVCPQIASTTQQWKKPKDLSRTLSRTVSIFSSSAILFDKLRTERSSSRESINLESKENILIEGEQMNNNSGMMNRIMSTYSRAYSLKYSPIPPTVEGEAVNNSFKEVVGSWIVSDIFEGWNVIIVIIIGLFWTCPPFYMQN